MGQEFWDQSKRASFFGDLPAGRREGSDELVASTADSLLLEVTKASNFHVRWQDDPEALGQQINFEVQLLKLEDLGIFRPYLAMIGPSKLETNLFESFFMRARGFLAQLGPQALQETLPRLDVALDNIKPQAWGLTNAMKRGVLLGVWRSGSPHVRDAVFRGPGGLKGEGVALVAGVDVYGDV